MTFKIASSPHHHLQRHTDKLMLLVVVAALPGIALQAYLFGYGVLVQIILAILTAWAAEAIILTLRAKPVLPRLKDHSALVAAVLLAIAIPPYAPWWLIVIGTAFAIIFVKQLYGGLGNNLFNPAMAAYIMLLISFPVQMTQWLPPVSLQNSPLQPLDAICMVFTQLSCNGLNLMQLQLGVDGTTLATPLDALRQDVLKGLTVTESLQGAVFSGVAGTGWLWVNLAYLLGGLFLLQQKVINWRIPVAVLTGLGLPSLLFWLFSNGATVSPLFHLLSGATMLAAFFIATDPVSSSTTERGRLYYGVLIGLLVFIIRTYGGYPDAFAFAVILANMCVPLIDYYTRPRTYGHQIKRAKS